MDPDRFAGPYFDAATAAACATCKSVSAWYCWRSRHGIKKYARGLVLKRDIDRALRTPRRMAAASLANLRKRSA